MRTHALIIKKQHTNEYDQLVTCFTKEFGKLTAIAKSALKMSSTQAMQLDTFNLVDFELVNGRGMPIIAAAQSINAHRNIKCSLPLLAAASFFLEVVDQIAFDEQRDDGLWELLAGALAAFNESSDERGRLLPLFRRWQRMLLDVLGYAPQTGPCVHCGAAQQGQPGALSVEHGGLVCQDCFLRGVSGVLITADDHALLNGHPAENTPSSRSALDALFEYTTNRRFSSLDLLYQSISRQMFSHGTISSA